MTDTIFAMMASIALTTASTPAAVILSPDIETRAFVHRDLSGAGTAASGISILEEEPESARPVDGITSAARDLAAARSLAGAAAKRMAAYRRLESTVLGYLSLPSNWDNDGGVAPQPGTVRDALFYLRDARKYVRAPRVFVVGDGEIGLSWESERGYAQVGFHNEGEIVVIARSADGRSDVRGVYNAMDVLPISRLREIISSL
jgi:hypothetical protein